MSDEERDRYLEEKLRVLRESGVEDERFERYAKLRESMGRGRPGDDIRSRMEEMRDYREGMRRSPEPLPPKPKREPPSPKLDPRQELAQKIRDAKRPADYRDRILERLKEKDIDVDPDLYGRMFEGRDPVQDHREEYLRKIREAARSRAEEARK